LCIKWVDVKGEVDRVSKKYWQIAGGSFGRDYSDLFIKFGMAFVGGDSQTMKEVEKGDIVLLKKGLYQIVAVGEVAERDGKHRDCGDKSWLRDIDGWDLQAYCYVDWRVPDTPIQTNGLTRATIQKVPQDKHKQLADSILQLPVCAYKLEPSKTELIDDNQILKFLISEGLRPSAADDLTNTFRRIRLLADYYYHYPKWEDIREHETRTFLIVPLLLALGWAEQQIKIELPSSKGKMSGSKGKIDIACFSKAYLRKDDECVLIIETKGFSSGLDYAPEEARGYVKAFPSCQILVVSNGYCYKTYIRKDSGDFSTMPSAYLNLLNPRDKYPLDPDNVKGALDVLRWLLPTALR